VGARNRWRRGRSSSAADDQINLDIQAAHELDLAPIQPASEPSVSKADTSNPLNRKSAPDLIVFCFIFSHTLSANCSMVGLMQIKNACLAAGEIHTVKSCHLSQTAMATASICGSMQRFA
jgi:hypothetical protein